MQPFVATRSSSITGERGVLRLYLLVRALSGPWAHPPPEGSARPRWTLNLGAGDPRLAVLLLILRIVAWISPGLDPFFCVSSRACSLLPMDRRRFLAGVLCYALPLVLGARWCGSSVRWRAHSVYARFSRFRILADKAKCLRAPVNRVCHQGIA